MLSAYYQSILAQVEDARYREKISDEEYTMCVEFYKQLQLAAQIKGEISELIPFHNENATGNRQMYEEMYFHFRRLDKILKEDIPLLQDKFASGILPVLTQMIDSVNGWRNPEITAKLPQVKIEFRCEWAIGMPACWFDIEKIDL